MADTKVEQLKARAHAIRLRTLSLTLAMLATLVLYLMVQVAFRDSINIVDFIFSCVLQITTHSLYFPDGDLFGQTSSAFVKNKTEYNSKASEINENERIAELREYCRVDYENRKRQYILNECGQLDITLEELNELKTLSEKEIKTLKRYEFKDKFITKNGKDTDKIIAFSKRKRKKLYKLIFESLPIEPNQPETIMSGVKNDCKKAIDDGSLKYKSASYLSKIFKAVVIGGVLAYISYTIKDGFGLAEVVKICVYVTSMFSTGVLAFSSGETCSKVYKSRFYVELINFIDGFNEWFNKRQSEPQPPEPIRAEEPSEPDTPLIISYSVDTNFGNTLEN